VLSGAAEALGEARRQARADGLKANRLPVAGAFHSPLMAAAAAGFEAALAEVEFRDPELPVFSSTAAAPFVADPGADAATQIRAGLAAALTQPVRWQATLKRMRAAGAEVFLETGPGDVLTGLVGRTLDGVEARSLAEEPEAAHV
jgi:malonyl CoA-acyl carrier protein transacylase